MRKALALGFAAVMPFLMAGAFLTLSASPLTPADVNNYSSPDFDHWDHGGDDVDAESAVDLLGNRVSDAVAKYKFDAAGSLYELHSPQTELPRLKPPRS